MDLTGMTRRDVDDLMHRLLTASAAADALEQGGFAPIIDLTDDGVMISASWDSVSTGVFGAAPVVIEEPVAGAGAGVRAGAMGDGRPEWVDRLREGFRDHPDQPEDDQAEDAWPEDASTEDADLSGISSPAAEPPPAATGTVAGVEVPAPPGQHPPGGEGGAPEIAAPKIGMPESAGVVPDAPEGEAPAPLVAGPLSDDEKAEMRRRHALGETPRDIATALNRRTHVVSAWISGLAHQEKLQALRDMAQAVAPAGGNAPAAPPPAAPASRPAAEAPALPPVPANVTGEHRRIWDGLNSPGTGRGFGPATDLAIWEACDTGAGVQMLALDLGVDGAALFGRYKAMIGCIADAKGRPRPELRMKLAAVLRWRADAAAASAKAAGARQAA